MKFICSGYKGRQHVIEERVVELDNYTRYNTEDLGAFIQSIHDLGVYYQTARGEAAIGVGRLIDTVTVTTCSGRPKKASRYGTYPPVNRNQPGNYRLSLVGPDLFAEDGVEALAYWNMSEVPIKVRRAWLLLLGDGLTYLGALAQNEDGVKAYERAVSDGHYDEHLPRVRIEAKPSKVAPKPTKEQKQERLQELHGKAGRMAHYYSSLVKESFERALSNSHKADDYARRRGLPGVEVEALEAKLRLLLGRMEKK